MPSPYEQGQRDFANGKRPPAGNSREAQERQQGYYDAKKRQG